jgi:anti-anti-sigma regulatory factor
LLLLNAQFLVPFKIDLNQQIMLTVATLFPGAIPCVLLNGRLDTVNSKRFEDALGELFDQHNRIVVDFSQC